MILRTPFTPELTLAHAALVMRATKRLGKVDPASIGVRTFSIDLKAKQTKDSTGTAYELDGIATTDRTDCDEEVVMPDGADWSMLTDPKSPYKSLYTDHFYGTPNVVATVRFITRSKSPDGWRIRARMMPDDYGEHVTQTRMLAERRALGLSIGFMATDRGQPTPEERKAYPAARSIVRKWKAFEVSTTPMPCNLDCGASVLAVDDEKAAVVAELVTKGLAPAWAGRLFAAKRRVLVFA